jgi:transposase InsO family protein
MLKRSLLQGVEASRSSFVAGAHIHVQQDRVRSRVVGAQFCDPLGRLPVRDARIGQAASREDWRIRRGLDVVVRTVAGDVIVGFSDGRRFRTLTLIDVFTRECLEIELGQNLRAEDVVRVLERLKYDRGVPGRVYCDNGSEFISGLMDQWAYSNGVKIEFSRLGKPTDNAVIESFNGRFREECLNTHWFESLDDARAKIDAWRWDYLEMGLQ